MIRMVSSYSTSLFQVVRLQEAPLDDRLVVELHYPTWDGGLATGRSAALPTHLPSLAALMTQSIESLGAGDHVAAFLYCPPGILYIATIRRHIVTLTGLTSCFTLCQL